MKKGPLLAKPVYAKLEKGDKEKWGELNGTAPVTRRIALVTRLIGGDCPGPLSAVTPVMAIKGRACAPHVSLPEREGWRGAQHKYASPPAGPLKRGWKGGLAVDFNVERDLGKEKR